MNDDKKIKELIGAEEKNNNYNNYKRQEGQNNKWKEQDKKRQEAYKKIDDMSFKIVKDGNVFAEYLKVLSNFEKYSVANCMLILEKAPNATQIKAKKDWSDKGYEVTEGAEPIVILEPNKTKYKTYYNPIEEYDISQTNAPTSSKKRYTEKEILQALFTICKAEKEVVDILPNGNKGVEYIESENKLYMCRGLKTQDLLKATIQEIVKMKMEDREQTEMNAFQSYCVSYMLCRKYGIDVTSFNFSELPKEITDNDKSWDIRKILENIQNDYKTVNDEMTEYFAEKKNEKENKKQESR